MRAASSRIAQVFGYEAGEQSHRRAPKNSRLLYEDDHLPGHKRKRMVATTRDAIRNFVRVGAAVRKHLDFVARHTVDFQTGDKGLNHELEAMVAEWSLAENFDAARRHDLDRFIRLAEARRTIDGDFFALKLRSGHLQGIEGDRVRDPGREVMGINQTDAWHHGIRCNSLNEPVELAISRRTMGGFEHEKIVRANRVLGHYWWDTHFRLDASRGVSPFAPGLNDFIDEHESITHAHAKLKLAQIFGLKVISTALDAGGEHTELTDSGDDDDDDGSQKYEVDYGKGPFKVEMDPGEDMEVVESKTGVTEVVEFLKFVADLAVMVLDLPPHFFDASRTNFHGGKVGTTLYLLSAGHKRRDVQRFLDGWLDWRIQLAIADRKLVLPRSVSIDHVLHHYVWIPAALPWFDRSKEVRPTLQAIAGGIDTYSRVIQEQYGMSLEQFLEIKKRDQELIEASGVQLANFDKLIMLPGNESDDGDDDE